MAPRFFAVRFFAVRNFRRTDISPYGIFAVRNFCRKNFSPCRLFAVRNFRRTIAWYIYFYKLISMLAQFKSHTVVVISDASDNIEM